MKKYLVLTLLFAGCKGWFDASVPQLDWQLFDSAQQLSFQRSKTLEGIYAVEAGNDHFGEEAVVKCSYSIIGTDTITHLSIFFEDGATLITGEGRHLSDTMLFGGFWRRMVNTETGPLQLVATNDSTLAGRYGDEQESPEHPIKLTRVRKLLPDVGFEVIAHRGGGRNNDLLPASENSVEMIKLGSRLGATGIEIDVKMTSDSIPVLYHDERINDRCIDMVGIGKKVGEYSLKELQAMKLTRGGTIPTLEAALDTILNKTPYRFVWLDCKFEGSIEKVYQLQQRFLKLARSRNRSIEIVLGIPDEESLRRLTDLPDYLSVPSLVELDTSVAVKIDAHYWAPSWLKGTQNETVLALQARNIRTITWTVDLHNRIEAFIQEGHFAGIVSNRPGMVAFYYWSRRKD